MCVVILLGKSHKLLVCFIHTCVENFSRPVEMALKCLIRFWRFKTLLSWFICYVFTVQVNTGGQDQNANAFCTVSFVDDHFGLVTSLHTSANPNLSVRRRKKRCAPKPLSKININTHCSYVSAVISVCNTLSRFHV